MHSAHTSCTVGVSILAALVVIGAAAAQPSDSVLTLQAVLDGVRIDNALLRASHLEVTALATRARQQSSFSDPTAMVGYQPFPLLTARGVQRSQWRVEQKIPYPGTLALRGEVARLDAAVAGHEAETLEADLFLEAKHAYYELYRIQQQELRIRAFQQRLQVFADNVAARYAAGGGAQHRILQIQLSRNMLDRTVLVLRAQRSAATQTLARLLNRPALSTPAVTIIVESPLTMDLEEAAALETALALRPEAAALDVAAERANALVALAHKKFRPDFSLSLTWFDIGTSKVLPSANGRDALAVGVSLRLPIHRDRMRAAVEEARVRQNQIHARKEALETAVRTQITDMAGRIDEAASQLLLYRETLIPQAETALRAVLNAYATDTADVSDLIDAEQRLFELGTGYEDTVAHYLKATAALERALGIQSLAELHAP